MGYLCTIYKKKNYKIYDDGKKGYIIHNTNLDFQNHHTHINNFHTCKFIIDLCINKKIPDKSTSKYLLMSIIRLTNDNAYKNKIYNIIDRR